MKNLATLLLLFTFFSGFSQSFYTGYGEPKTTYYTTETKSCGHCGATVSNNSTVGMRCPHCGVIWGRENTTTTTSYASRNIPSTGFATTTTSANLRTGPSTNHSVICTMPAYNSLTILDKSGNWVKVAYTDYSDYNFGENKTGWVSASLLNY